MFIFAFSKKKIIAVLVLTSNEIYGQSEQPHSIQVEIIRAFEVSIAAGNTTLLESIKNRLKSNDSQMAVYWSSYAKFYESLYYLKNQDEKRAKKIINSAISMLEKVPDKNSEIYALLAYLQNFSIQFSGGFSAAFTSGKVKNNAEAALKLDSLNLRAWYVLALNDYYTPAAYGGGKKCENYLLKTVSLNPKSSPYNYMPSWGKNDAYALLIGYYIKNEKFSKAKENLKIALSLYPDDKMIKQYDEVLKNK